MRAPHEDFVDGPHGDPEVARGASQLGERGVSSLTGRFGRHPEDGTQRLGRSPVGHGQLGQGVGPVSGKPRREPVRQGYGIKPVLHDDQLRVHFPLHGVSPRRGVRYGVLTFTILLLALPFVPGKGEVICMVTLPWYEPSPLIFFPFGLGV